MRRVKIKVTGDVQGVSYRYWAKDLAKKLRILGWIENSEDGSVEAEVEGEEAAVGSFIEWAEEGSPMATVENVTVEDKEYKGEFDRFEVK